MHGQYMDFGLQNSLQVNLAIANPMKVLSHRHHTEPAPLPGSQKPEKD